MKRENDMRPGRGFTLVEILVALVIFGVVMGAALTFLVTTVQHDQNESKERMTGVMGRLAIDRLGRDLAQAGTGISRPDPTNPTSWQRAVVFADPYTVAINADLDGAIGALANPADDSSAPTLTFSDGSAYTGEAQSGDEVATTDGAETLVFTIDPDSGITGSGMAYIAADRNYSGDGFNPAQETETPRDFGLFVRVYGFTGDATLPYGGELKPIAGNLFTNAVADTNGAYPSGKQPNPLFTYWLTEDLNGDGTVDFYECLTDCSADEDTPITRSPLLYMWGDDDFDGELTDAEKTALRDTYPAVGDADWPANPLTESTGTFTTDTLANTGQAGAGPLSTFIVVDESEGFAPGQYISVGSGDELETFQVAAVDHDTNIISLTSDIMIDHAIGDTVTVLPRTLLSAIRAIEVRFDAISPHGDNQVGVGHQGAEGGDMAERVLTFRTRAETANLPTVARREAGAEASSLVECPVDIVPYCFAAEASMSLPASMTVWSGASSSRDAVSLGYYVSKGGIPLDNIDVRFTHTNSSNGSFENRRDRTNGLGLAELLYFPKTAAYGDDVITASVVCIDDVGPPVEFDSSTVDFTISSSILELMDMSDGNTDSGLGYTGDSNNLPFTFRTFTRPDDTGTENAVTSQNVSLSLGFVTGSAGQELPPSFSEKQLTLKLDADGASVSTTDGSGNPALKTGLGAGGTGEIPGDVQLTVDDDRTGVRGELVASIASTPCTASDGGLQGAKVEQLVDFLRPNLIPALSHDESGTEVDDNYYTSDGTTEWTCTGRDPGLECCRDSGANLCYVTDDSPDKFVSVAAYVARNWDGEGASLATNYVSEADVTFAYEYIAAESNFDGGESAFQLRFDQDWAVPTGETEEVDDFLTPSLLKTKAVPYISGGSALSSSNYVVVRIYATSGADPENDSNASNCTSTDIGSGLATGPDCARTPSDEGVYVRFETALTAPSCSLALDPADVYLAGGADFSYWDDVLCVHLQNVGDCDLTVTKMSFDVDGTDDIELESIFVDNQSLEPGVDYIPPDDTFNCGKGFGAAGTPGQVYGDEWVDFYDDCDEPLLEGDEWVSSVATGNCQVIEPLILKDPLDGGNGDYFAFSWLRFVDPNNFGGAILSGSGHTVTLNVTYECDELTDCGQTTRSASFPIDIDALTPTFF